MGSERKMINYKWQSDRTKMLKMLRMSATIKEKNGWTRDSSRIGAGFIADDISSMTFVCDKHNTILFEFGDERKQALTTGELNLRETDEAIKFLTRIYVSEMNPHLRASELYELGYKGTTADELLKNVQKDYPSAHLIE